MKLGPGKGIQKSARLQFSEVNLSLKKINYKKSTVSSSDLSGNFPFLNLISG